MESESKRETDKCNASNDESHDAEMLTLQNIVHQLRSPLHQVESRARTALFGVSASQFPELWRELSAIKGLASKAGRVLRSAKLFADLQQGKIPKVHLVPVPHAAIVKLLIEVAQDFELISQQHIRCSVRRQSFDVLQNGVLFIDPDLFGSAISNVVDNAFKYSFDNTDVVISGGLTGKHRFYISVENIGIGFDKSEIDQCILRGWRGEQARLVTSEGLGLGLWITNSIMTALGGHLHIFPSKSNGMSEVRLVFDLRRHAS